MSGVCSGSLQLSSSKPCVEHNVSNSEMNVGNKRKKVSFSTPVAMKSENPEAHLEPVVMKRKRTSGHSFEGKLKEEIVPGELALGKRKKLTTCKENEQVQLVNSKEGCLNKILPEQKQAAKCKGAGNEIDGYLNKLEKKCRIRRAKLFQKHVEQFKEFDRIWEKKRSDLERDYKLELSIIRSIYGEGTSRTDIKLKLLEHRFGKKIKDHNLLKDVEHKKLKAEQLAARNEERQMRARWLAACSSGDPTADHGPETLGLQSEEVGRDVPIGNSSTGPQNDRGLALSQASVLAGVEQNICVPSEIRAVPLNNEVPPEVPETVAKENVDYVNPVKLCSTSHKWTDNGDATGLPDASVTLGDEIDEEVGLTLVEQILEPPEQTKASWTPHRCTSLLPQASEDQIPDNSISDIIQDIGAQVNPLQDQSAQVVENQNASPFEVAASLHVDTVTDTSLGEVANLDAIDVALEESSDKLQDQDATDLENQATPCIEVANSESVEIVNPVQSNVGAPATAVLNCEELSAVDVFPSCNKPCEVESQNYNLKRSSSQTAEIADTVMVSHESSSQLGENHDLQSKHIVTGSGSPINLERMSSQTAEIADAVVVSHESSQLGENQDLQSNYIDTGSGSPVNLERISCQTTEIVVVSHDSPSQLGGNQVLQSNHFDIGSASQVNMERISSQTAEIPDNVVVSHESSSQLRENQDIQSNHFGIGSGSQVNLERISSHTAEITDTVLLSHESTSQQGGNRDLHSNHVDIGSSRQIIHETSVEVSTSSRNNVDMSQLALNTLELPHQAVLQLGSLGNFYGSVNPLSRHQGTSFSSPPLYAAPLPHELEKISKEIEQLKKSHEGMKLQLKSDCEKEVREMLAQINSKYDLKLLEAEAEFSNKKTGLDNSRSKVLRNELLAEIYSSNCRDLCREIQQASPYSSMQQHLMRPPPMPMSHQPVLGHPITTPNIQQLLLCNPTRHTPITPPPLQTAQLGPAFSFRTTSQPLRPLVINAITPTTNPGLVGNVRSGAPHLQPHAASFMPTPTFPSNTQPFQLRPSQPLQSPPMQPSTFQNRTQFHGEPPALLNSSLSAPGFLMGVDDRQNIPTSSCLPQINPSFGSLEQSHLARLRNVQGNWTSSAAVNTISISDDD